MQNVLRALVVHDLRVSFPQDASHQVGDVGLVPEVGERGEEGLEVEDDGTRTREAAQSLPVDAEEDVVDGETGILLGALREFGVGLLEEERFADFEAPGATLNGFLGFHPLEVSDRICEQGA